MQVAGKSRRTRHTSRRTRALSTTVVAAVGLTLVGATTTAPSVAAPRPSPDTPWTTVASGLDNPRLLSWSRDGLYVAESGRGGAKCQARPDEPDDPDGPAATVCLGRTGAVARVRFDAKGRPHVKRVVRRLPSIAGPGGTEATGPADVVVKGQRWWVTVGLGGTTELRDLLGRDAARLGTVVAGRFAHRKGRTHVRAWSRISADLAAFEARYDPDGAGNDSNPTGLTSVRGGLAVTDSGGNDVLFRDPRSRLSLISTLPSRMVPAPPFLPPGEIPMQSVPTSVVQGPDGDYYVSELTGFPFPTGGAVVWRIAPDTGEPEVYASGLTNLTDLAWHRGKLYVVQLVDDGLLSADPEAGMPEGSLRRIEADGSSTVVAEGLPAPYGLALRAGAAYVTTCTFCAGDGAVVRIPLK